MKKVKVYVEGATRGKNKNDAQVRQFRKAFVRFAEQLDLRNTPRFIPCGGRSQTWEAAYQEFLRRDEDEIVMLLVDSEEATQFLPTEAWQHLRNREHDEWLELNASHKRYVFMMVATMETWLIADVDALARHFGQEFRRGSIPAWPNLEEVPKEDVYNALDAATAGTERPYRKGERSFEAFEQVNPAVVSEKCPHAARFVERLRAECNAP